MYSNIKPPRIPIPKAPKIEEPKMTMPKMQSAPKMPSPGKETIGALHSELQRRHMSPYVNPSETLPHLPSDTPTADHFTKIRNLLRVKYGGGKMY